VNPLYHRVARRAGHRCEYCHAPEVLHNGLFEVEHVTPVAAGGTDDLDNLALSCRACNSRKGDATTGVDPQTGRSSPLFDPRRDQWADHFAVDLAMNELIGLSPTGRATIAALDMNNLCQLTARQFWVRLGLFP
jgi:hypothetical protein